MTPTAHVSADLTSHPGAGPAPIDRVSGDDLVTLLTDIGPAPMHAGAVLVLDGCEDMTLDALRTMLSTRIVSVPRLRRRLVRPPFGGGRAVWVDDGDFDVTHHVHEVRCAPPGGDVEMFEEAATALATPLSVDHPSWRAVLLTGLRGDRSAIVLVMHHVLADGIGGLAVLAQLVDGSDVGSDVGSEPTFPRARPTSLQLRLDAVRSGWLALRRWRDALRRVGAAVHELRAGTGPRLPRSSLLQPTGARRRFAVVRVDLAAVHGAARAAGATVNDLVLVAIASTLRQVLSERGEDLPELVASIPISARGRTSAERLGNEVGAVPIRVPTTGDDLERLRGVADATRRAKDAPRGVSSSVLGPVFRTLARLHLFRPFIERQRLVQTFVTNLRGPEAPMTVLGATVIEVVPIAAVPGNVSVSFAVFSYSGTLGITILADARAWPDLNPLRTVLEGELGRLTALRPASPAHAPR